MKVFWILFLFQIFFLINFRIKCDEEKSEFLYNDYCNINEGKIVYYLFRDIENYFKLNNSKSCLILDEKFSYYIEQFLTIGEANKVTYNNFKCPICTKKFRSIYLLYLHYKLFHLKREKKNNLFCLSDFCQSINCRRYGDFFNIKLNLPGNENFNKQPIEKVQVCDPDLIQYYKNTCMKLVEGCFDDKKKLFKYFKYICNEIKCENGKEVYLEKDSSLYDVVRVIFMYICGILSFIYLIIIWLTKYS